MKTRPSVRCGRSDREDRGCCSVTAATLGEPLLSRAGPGSELGPRDLPHCSPQQRGRRPPSAFLALRYWDMLEGAQGSRPRSRPYRPARLCSAPEPPTGHLNPSVCHTAPPPGSARTPIPPPPRGCLPCCRVHPPPLPSHLLRLLTGVHLPPQDGGQTWERVWAGRARWTGRDLPGCVPGVEPPAGAGQDGLPAGPMSAVACGLPASSTRWGLLLPACAPSPWGSMGPEGLVPVGQRRLLKATLQGPLARVAPAPRQQGPLSGPDRRSPPASPNPPWGSHR